MNDNCIFCNIKKEEIFYKNDFFNVFIDFHPVTFGHLIIVPKRHIVDFFDLTEKELISFKNIKQEIFNKLKKVNLNYEYKQIIENNKDNKLINFFCDDVLKLGFKDFSIKDYNLGINKGKYAGQTINHLHIHLIPRYDGDNEEYIGGVRNIIDGKGNYKN